MPKKTNQPLQHERKTLPLCEPGTTEMPLVPDSQNSVSAVNSESPVQIGSFISLEMLEEAHLRKIIERTPSLTAAAAILGIDQATLYRKRKKIGLK
jgi:NtrC-family two-component system response regulator AlgB